MANIHDYFEQFDSCRQHEEPACTNTCPFHLNVLDFQDKMSRHKYDRAYRDYKNAVCFPDIVAILCPEYCNQVCPRKDYDGAVQLNLLEKTCVAKAKRKDPTGYNVPPKEGRVGIIGAGISGLTCALKLLEKKYEVIVFEKQSNVGGQLKDLLSEDVYMTDIQRQFNKVQYELKTDMEVKSLDDLGDYDFTCIYVATGNGGNDFGTLGRSNGYCYIKDGTAVFGGGSLMGKDVVSSIADGIDIAWAIEVYLKTKVMEYPGVRPGTKVVPDADKFVPCPPVEPTDEGIFTDEETEMAANRCIRCQCDACRTWCDIAEFYDQWPLSMREDVMMTVMSTESMIHKSPAIRLLNTCTQCDLCQEVCPPHIEINHMMLQGRKLLHQQGKMPPAYHGFWLDDLEHANSGVAKICKNSPGSDRSKYAFFPGCNLGAADVRYVSKTYEWLNKNFENMGLLLRCCGITADWAGNEVMHEDQIQSLKSEWQELGNPILVTTCPSCTKHIRKYLPHVKTISLYELMKEKDLWPQFEANDVVANIGSSTFSIFDPCSVRGDENVLEAVRDTARQIGLEFDELPDKDKHGCCGFGGNPEVCSPEFAKMVAEKRATLSSNPYITYCMNCRDIFLDEGKPTVHMLDLLFHINDLDAKLPSLTKRRANRVQLKQTLLKQIWGENMTEPEKQYPFEIKINEDIKDKMDRLKLVDDDVKQVIEVSNQLNRRTHDKNMDEYICYAKLNYITCWVRYQKDGATYNITNVYTHRMDIKLEAVFNGRKTDAHM